ncbi:hypothetical protein S40293_06949 [Stachybotrys chartarum IBT 40293]|nr:hypothetical protein S40293_06949 [Stachybotrys chartarum IBT 40293]
MSSRDDNSLGGSPPTFESQPSSSNGAPPTYAAFSPATLSSNGPSRSSRRSTILVHQKSPLLLATPPQITRALAYSHPFLLPLNTLVGLLTWSSGDPWQSFLLLCAFWATVLYGDAVLKWAGPVVVGIAIIGGMYGRRYSPLSSSGWSEPAREVKEFASQALNPTAARNAKNPAANTQAKHNRGNSEATNTKHQKTLDEIVDILKEFTARCNLLLEPLLEMTDFLSTQRTPTSATTRPALTAMFMRLLILTPFWILLTIPPWRIITTRRVMLVAGTVVLTWHAKVMRVTRTVLWRSLTIRRLASAITGLHFDNPVKFSSNVTMEENGEVKAQESELTKALKKPSNLHVTHRRTGSSKTAGVKFTFIIYENQRRWVGLGWTTSLFAYERPAWTDEHQNAVSPKDEFELPAVEDGSNMRWRWAQGSRWRVDGVPDDHGPIDYDGEEAKNGWIYYDSKWQNGRRGSDGWGRWTRRRKWYRDGELVEVDPSEIHELESTALKPNASTTALPSPGYSTMGERMVASNQSEPTLVQTDGSTKDDDSSIKTADDASVSTAPSSLSRSFFRAPSLRRRPTNSSIDKEKEKEKDKEKDKDKDKNRPRRQSEVLDEDSASGLGIDLDLELQKQGKDGGRWGIGDEARMSLE